MGSPKQVTLSDEPVAHLLFIILYDRLDCRQIASFHIES